MLAQYGYFYIHRYSNMNRQRDLDTVSNMQSNDKPYLKARKKKKKKRGATKLNFFYSALELFLLFLLNK